MSLRRIQKLEAIIEHLEQHLDDRPRHYLLHVDGINGAGDATRFERDYGIPPAAVSLGALVVERRHFQAGAAQEPARGQVDGEPQSTA